MSPDVALDLVEAGRAQEIPLPTLELMVAGLNSGEMVFLSGSPQHNQRISRTLRGELARRRYGSLAPLTEPRNWLIGGGVLAGLMLLFRRK